ncbi:cyclic nucleotide-binding protein [[Leptolyngbya] sp. PCC 7376]|uniref:SpoIIE family protein phosphatase n=1 Tax=[Leptolyngbya] sp. PCC 7376 TaxID=111781 RepID=UPI00029EC4A6|nr:SpoIIE family protein phosphatase [[Leptolyngbya] sp. PCC 7376]AFY40332.1 cyclic nucleotide-binding protein [[Leptolyngbya] sp. PCC 7376]
MSDSLPNDTVLSFGESHDDWEAIAGCELFQGVQPVLLKDLLQRCSIQSFPAGSTLTEPGQENHTLYILLGGHLMVYLAETEDAVLNPEMGFQIPVGECIGEMSIIENKPVSAYVVAATECRLLSIPESLFWDELMSWPEVVKSMLTGLSSRMRRLDKVAIKTLEERLRFEQIERDLKAAAQIQSNILPQEKPLLAQYHQVDVAASIEPAREVGGDFFDTFPIDEHTVGLAIGDVSGKGIPAALFMIRAVTILRASIARLNIQDENLASIFSAVNRQLCESNPNCLFVTIFLGTLDVRTGKLTYVHGGHNRPFLKRVNEGSAMIPIPDGMLLGIFAEAEYKLAELTLGKGDLLVMYTDGVTEARDRDGQFFMEERVTSILDQLPATISSTDIVSVLGNRVKNFTEQMPQSDDITIMTLRYKGEPPEVSTRD